ncbi:MAG: hypothetical protein QOD06_1343 [Candidatus Binatota bacterium]|jgi:hypothetical protein|nr:hypothetical protein [Candidatus Binatota bacterium]
MTPRRAFSVVLAVLLFPLATTAQAELLRSGPWELGIGGQIGVPRGHVKVGENTTPGNRLRLHGDLGIDLSESVDLRIAYHVTAEDALRFSFSSLFLYGSKTLPRDTFFNGAILAGGTNLNTRPQLFRLTALYARNLLPPQSGGSFEGVAGVTFVYMDFKMNGMLAPTTRGRETKEDFYAQELPIPLLGFRTGYPLTDRLRLLGSLLGGYLPRVSSLRNEGGDVKLTQSHADVALGLEYGLTPTIRIEGGYRYTYFVQHETSREDDNDFRLSDNALTGSVSWRF